MAAFQGGGGSGGGAIIATGITGAFIYAGPRPSGATLIGVSSGYTSNPGLTPITPPPGSGLTPGGVGNPNIGDLSGGPAGSGCTGCGGS